MLPKEEAALKPSSCLDRRSVQCWEERGVGRRSSWLALPEGEAETSAVLLFTSDFTLDFAPCTLVGILDLECRLELERLCDTFQ